MDKSIVSQLCLLMLFHDGCIRHCLYAGLVWSGLEIQTQAKPCTAAGLLQCHQITWDSMDPLSHETDVVLSFFKSSICVRQSSELTNQHPVRRQPLVWLMCVPGDTERWPVKTATVAPEEVSVDAALTLVISELDCISSLKTAKKSIVGFPRSFLLLFLLASAILLSQVVHLQSIFLNVQPFSKTFPISFQWGLHRWFCVTNHLVSSI